MGTDSPRGDVTPLTTELGRLRYFLEKSGISREGVDNIIHCYTEAVVDEARRLMMNDRNMVGFCQEYYTLQNVDGHDLVLDGPNRFLTEELATEMAARVCVEYRDMVLVRQHVDTVTRVFTVSVTAQEVSDTSDVAS